MRRGSAGRARRAIRVFLALGAAALLADAGAGLALGYLFLHPVRLPVRRTPAEHGLRYESVVFRSRDGTRLAAWFVPAGAADRPGPAVLLCHGYPVNREDILEMIPPFHAAGFHVLAFDFRGLGQSGGRMSTLGWREPEDVLAGVAWLRGRAEVDPKQIGALGWSMGAASCLMAASRDPGIRAVVADSAFARLAEMPEQRLRFLPPLVRLPLADSTRAWAEVLAGFAADQVAPEAEVGRIAPRPILFIHGEADRLIPATHSRRLFAASGAPREIWTVPGAGHVRCHACRTEEYEQRVVAFFKRHLAP